MPLFDSFAIARSDNDKTGDIPQVGFGSVMEFARLRAADAAAEACKVAECTRLPKARGGAHGGCYAFRGHSALALSSAVKKERREPDTYPGGFGLQGLKRALARASRAASAVRFGWIGDPSALTDDQMRSLVDEVHGTKVATAKGERAMSLLSYTHAPERAPWLKSSTLASVTLDLQRAHELARAGWKVALEVWSIEDAPTEIGGRRAVVCPEQRQKRAPVAGAPKITCNTCRLCDARTTGPHIVFLHH